MKFNAFQFDNAKRTYPNGTIALCEFSLGAKKGERISVIGPSGCGKTTILRLISGLDKPDEPNTFKMNEKLVGMVFQDANLMPWANVFDNIYMPMRLNGVKRKDAKEKIKNILKRLYLENCETLFPYQLSGGMKMRVSIARALIMKPEILLLDEPFAALDEITRFKLNDLLLELHSQDKFTFVLVTHSVFESAYLSDRVAVMGHGKIYKEIKFENKKIKNYRESKIYGENCAKLSAELKNAIDEHGIE